MVQVTIHALLPTLLKYYLNCDKKPGSDSSVDTDDVKVVLQLLLREN